jgi:hypothetical protein
MVDVFREVRRVLRADGTLWLNLGDSYASGEVGRVDAGRGVDKQFASKYDDAQAPRAERRIKQVTGLKPKDLCGIPWRVAFALQADGWYLRSDIVWCLSGGTRLYARTQKGDMPASLKDLVRLDPATVKLWNGERWTQVLGWHRSESRGEPLEVELASGERIGCTPGHIWPTQRGNVRADELTPGDVLQTARLPQPETPDAPRFLPDAEVGWLVGRYLADGSMSGDTVQIACHANEAEDVRSRAGGVAVALHGSAVAHRTKGYAATVNLNGPLTAALVRGYVYGSNARTKGLTSRVWRRSDDFLRALLVGYLEGDGHYDEKNDRWRLGFTRNDRLAADLRTLAARLGLPLRLSIGTTTGFGKTWPVYHGQVRLTPERQRSEYGRVVAVRRSKGREFWDVEVEDDPHLFALASGVLTHNSKQNPMPESVTDRPTKAHEYVFLLTRSPRYFFDQEAVREKYQDGPGLTGGAYSPPGQSPHGNARGPDGRRVTRVLGADGSIQHRDGERWPNGGRNIRSVWEIATQPYAEAHFATFPEALVERCVKAGCPELVCGTCGKARERVTVKEPRIHKGDSGRTNAQGTVQRGKRADGKAIGTVMRERFEAGYDITESWSDCGHDNYQPGVVLDPFMGSGTTALVARTLGRRSIGVELSPEYAALAAKRLSQLSLLA